jgi:hypothetical protein
MGQPCGRIRPGFERFSPGFPGISGPLGGEAEAFGDIFGIGRLGDKVLDALDEPVESDWIEEKTDSELFWTWSKAALVLSTASRVIWTVFSAMLPPAARKDRKKMRR